MLKQILCTSPRFSKTLRGNHFHHPTQLCQNADSDLCVIYILKCVPYIDVCAMSLLKLAVLDGEVYDLETL